MSGFGSGRPSRKENRERESHWTGRLRGPVRFAVKSSNSKHAFDHTENRPSSSSEGITLDLREDQPC